jgi:hypothetical protein
MATFDLAFNERRDGVAVVQTFVPTQIQVEDSVTIAGAGNNLDGTHSVLSTEQFYFVGVDQYGGLKFDYDQIVENQILFYSAYSNLVRAVATGTVSFTPAITWCTNANVIEWLGIDSATANDTAFITKCVAASNYWCWNKRREAGYGQDSQNVAPNDSVKMGAILYAATLYRERGTSGDSYGSFTSMGQFQAPVSLSRIMQLLGCGRAQVA